MTSYTSKFQINLYVPTWKRCRDSNFSSVLLILFTCKIRPNFITGETNNYFSVMCK